MMVCDVTFLIYMFFYYARLIDVAIVLPDVQGACINYRPVSALKAIYSGFSLGTGHHPICLV
jgi:hypothetical protein